MSLANDLKRVNTKNITFATVPVLDNPDDPATVVLDEAKAKPLFKMVRDDKSMTKVKKDQKQKPASKAKKAPASEVEVQVWNGGAPAGAAAETSGWLRNEGAGKAETAEAAPQLKKTRLEYAPDQEGQAARVADMMGLPGSALKRVAESPSSDGSMKLTLGRDYSGAGEPITSPDKAPAGVKKVNADDKNMCAK